MNNHEPERNSETPTRAPETRADYCARVSAEILRECEARDNARRLRSVSFERACGSPAEIYSASSDRWDYPSDLAALRESDEERQAVRAAAEVFRESPDSGA